MRFFNTAGRVAPGEHRALDPLPPLREDIRLEPAPRARDGSPCWHLFDPVRNRFFRIGLMEFSLLSRWQAGSDAAALCAAVGGETPLYPRPEDVEALARFLGEHELLRSDAPERRRELARKAQARRLSAWTWLLHHYLFFRIPLVKTDAGLSALLPRIAFVFSPRFALAVGGLGLWGISRVIDRWDEFANTFAYFFSWSGLAWYGLALGIGKLVHELGHALTAKRYGLRVPSMGVAFMVMWPLLYTDTSEGWRLHSRRQRLAIAGAGVLAELGLAGLAALAWSFAPEGPLKSACYFLAAVSWISTLAVNLNPFMRFDGYYLLMDAIDEPNFQQRAFAVGRWWLRRRLLGVAAPCPEPEFEKRLAGVLAYAYATWLYRLIVFTGIAVAVYAFFFKLAGIFLFAVEIGWFVLRPAWQELKMWKKLWAAGETGTGRARRILLAAAVLLLALVLPWRGAVTGHGVLHAAPYARLYPPAPAQVREALVREGQEVRAGDKLFVLVSPELEMRALAARSRLAGLRAQLAGSVGEARLGERVRVLEQELAGAEAEWQGIERERERLVVSAPHAGVVRDVAEGLYPGAWIAPSRLLARVVGDKGGEAFAYVGEEDIQRLAVGNRARLVSTRNDAEGFDARVVAVEPNASRVLAEAALASTLGGPIAVRQAPRGEWVFHEAMYRVSFKLDPPAALPAWLPVQAAIAGDNSSLAWRGLRWGLNRVNRELGF